MEDQRIHTLFDAIAHSDLPWLKSTFECLDFDFNCFNPSNNPLLGCTALQAAVASFLGTDHDEVEIETVKIATWLVKRGADPNLRCRREFPQAQDWMSIFLEKHDQSDVRYTVAGHSAYSMLAQVQRDMRGSKHAENWSPYLRKLSGLMSTLAQTKPEAATVSMSPAVLEVWEKFSADKQWHDLVVEAIDGEVTAHAAFLACVSPVVASMLSSNMKEARSKRIAVDVPTKALSFMFELLYTGASSKVFSNSFALPALDLAHRWQITHIVEMLETPVAGALNVENFADVSESAVLKDLPKLKLACRNFAHEHPEVLSEDLPQSVQEYLQLRRPSWAARLNKKQRIFY
ncbi:BTB/POZ and TAZ domain-containing protein 5 (BTB and TAZ domain protein 5) [Durusdinium trenchii]